MNILPAERIIGLLIALGCASAYGAAQPAPHRLGEGFDVVKKKDIKEVSGPHGTELQLSSTDKKGKNLNFSLKVTDPSYKNGACPKIKITFEYLDEGHGELYMEVDSSDPLYGAPDTPGAWKRSGGVQMHDTGQWLEAGLFIYDAHFGGRLNGADLRFQKKSSKSLRVRNLQIAPLSKGRYDMAGKPVLKDKPNILLIIVDDLNDYNGAFGDPNALTPNINAFSKSGLRFTKTYCQYPVCGPSRASFMSGLYPETNGVTDNGSHIRATKPDATNMLEFFKEQGYWTASAGKIFHGDTNPMESGISTYQSDWFHDSEEFYLTKKFKPEFEARVGPVEDHEEEWDKHYKENYASPQKVVQLVATEADVPDEFHVDGKVRTRICEHIEQKPYGEQPFFIACGFTRPHVPHFAPKRFFDLYPKDKLNFKDVPVNDWENKPSIASDKKYLSYGAKMGENDRELRAKWLQAYLACISFVDEQIGKVLTSLRESGEEENTIIIFMTDHGYHIGEHFLYGKVTLFEESTRIPFVVRVPGMTQAGTTTDAMTELVDIFPSLAELCGFTPPADLDGKSFVPVLKKPETQVKDTAYTVVTRTDKGQRFLGKALRYKQWRYAEWGSPDLAELYDLSKDPNEYTNLAANPEYSDLIKNLRKKMAEKVAL